MRWPIRARRCPSGRSHTVTLLQLLLFMELDQQIFTILRQSVHSTLEPVPLRSEQVCFCPQVLDVSLLYLQSLRNKAVK